MARPKAYKGHNPLYGHACAAFSIHSVTHCLRGGIPKSSKSLLHVATTDLADSLCQTLTGGLGLGCTFSPLKSPSTCANKSETIAA